MKLQGVLIVGRNEREKDLNRKREWETRSEKERDMTEKV